MAEPLDINLSPKALKSALAKALDNKIDYGVFTKNPKYPNRRNYTGEVEVKVGDSVSIKWDPKLREGYIDVEGAKGATKQSLKADFDKVRSVLPKDSKFGLNPGDAKNAAGETVGRKHTKHLMYKRWFKNDSQVSLNADEGLRNRPGGSQEGFILDTSKRKGKVKNRTKLAPKQQFPIRPEGFTVKVHGQKMDLDQNNLRGLTNYEHKHKIYPQSASEAVEKGINVYQRKDGSVRNLRWRGGPKQKPTKWLQKEVGLDLIDESLEQRQRTRHQPRRRANEKNKAITKQDYRNYAEKHGYTQAQADKLYKTNETKLRLLKKHKWTRNRKSLHYEHLTPNASKYTGGLEHWRNLGLLGKKANIEKSDLLISRGQAKNLGIPLTKDTALKMDFEGKKALPPRVLRKNIEKNLLKQAKEGKPLSARNQNTIIDKLKKGSLGSYTKLAQGSRFMMRPATAAEIHEGNYKKAAAMYAQDLATGAGYGAAFSSASNVAMKGLSSKLAKRGALKILGKVGTRVATRAGASLVGGPAMPAIMAALLAKDIYDVSDALTGGKVEDFRKRHTNQYIRGRSGAKRDKLRMNK